MSSGSSHSGVAGGAYAHGARPKVVVLSPWGQFGEVGERDILERAGCDVIVSKARTDEEVIAAVHDADAIIPSWGLSAAVMASLTKCRVIARSSIGMDTIHGIDIATEKGIVVCNVPDVFVNEVADHTYALLLACVRHIVPLHNYVVDGGWSDLNRQHPMGPISHHVYGQTLGLVGFGNIGRAVAKRAHGFDLKVIAYDPFTPKEVFLEAGVRQATLGQVLQDSDFVSLHVPLMDSTHHLIGAPQFRLMKPSALLINTCRGPVVDEAALIDALNHGMILGAGLDVTEEEPTPSDNPLVKMSNVVITPHTASASDLAGAERRRRPSHEVVAVLTGHRPRAVWNPPVLAKLNLK